MTEEHVYVHLADSEEEARRKLEEDGYEIRFLEPLKEGKWHAVVGQRSPAKEKL